MRFGPEGTNPDDFDYVAEEYFASLTNAEHHLTKPFSLRELAVRVKAILRRSEASAPAPEVLEVGGAVIDLGRREVRAGGAVVDCTGKEFELLRYLAENPGRVFSRAKLLQEVWGYDFYGGTRTVDVHVRRVRAKLGPEFESLIETVRSTISEALPRTRVLA